jgi:hypothetical protein
VLCREEDEGWPFFFILKIPPNSFLGMARSGLVRAGMGLTRGGQSGKAGCLLRTSSSVILAPPVPRAAQWVHFSPSLSLPNSTRAVFLSATAKAGQPRAMSMSNVNPKQGTVTVTIIDPVTAKEGRTIHARIGASVLDVAQEHDMVCFYV